MSLDKLAELIGVSRETAWRWEVGERFPDRKLWPKIAEVTGITADQMSRATATPKAKESEQRDAAA